MNIRLQQIFLSAAVLFFAATIQAQKELDPIRRDIQPGNMPPIKVCITGFSGEVADVLNFDLFVMGFANVARDQAQFIITGSNEGNVQGRVLNPLNQTILSKVYSGTTLRRQAHAFADDIVQAVTGNKGVAQTRIVFKAGAGMNSEVCLADFDGHNAQAVTSDNTIVAAPAWSPGRQVLYYTSYKFGRPEIFFHDLASGQRRAIARYGGSNISPAPSPDGSKVAMILSKDGWVDLYVCNTDGSDLKRLTKTPEDDSSPCWSPDSQWICFATKVNGRRKLCKVPAAGGAVQTIRTDGVSSPSEPDWSPDGRWIAFTAQMGNFEICVVPAGGGTATVLVDGKDSSWSPNSRTLVFVRQDSGEAHLSLLDVPTKQVKDVTRVLSRNNSQPSWAR
jgi:TolB protein